MNTLEEIKTFAMTIPCGEPIFDITVNQRYRDDISLSLIDWPEQTTLTSSGTTIEKIVGYAVKRVYDVHTKELRINTEYVVPRIQDFVQNGVIKLATETSLTDQPKRTIAYKEIVEIAYVNRRDESFINDMLPIIDYYNKSKTDNIDMKVHNNNVQALFNILRKKYSKSISKKK